MQVQVLRRLLLNRAGARRVIDPLQLYVLIVSLSYFHLSNGHTLSVIFKQDIYEPEWLAEHKQIARDVVLRYVKQLD